MSHAQIILLAVCGIIATLAVPLILRRVPPNRVYGFRTRRTLADPALWYRVNRFAGWTELIASALSVVLIVSRPPPSNIWLQLVVPQLVALVAALLYLWRAA
jgi:uncharacterized membrane protein